MQAEHRFQRLKAGDSVGLERDNGEWMKGVVVFVEDDGIDVVVDGQILEGEVLSVSRAVQDDARYTAVMEVVSAGPGRSRVRLVGDWKRVQMRQFVRVAVLGVRVNVRKKDGPERAAADAPDPRLLDISAGGLCFEGAEDYSNGQILDLAFNLPQGGPVTARGEVIRVAGSRGDDTGITQYGVRFCGMTESTRVKIMTWVFAEQARRFRESSKPDGEPPA